MNKGFLTLGIIIMASLTLIIINVISSYSTGGEVDFYLVKETSESALKESLDPFFLSRNGVIRMDKEKFMESFIRRFADNVNDTREYTIGFYGLNEVPPKVSIKIDSATALSFEGEAAVISTTINQLAEMTPTENRYVEKEVTNPNSYLGEPVKVVTHSGSFDEVVRKGD